jgi:hypothetical protein
MFTSFASSPVVALMMIVTGGGIGLYLFFFVMRRRAPDVSLSTNHDGYRPGEGVRARGGGSVLLIGANDNLGRASGATDIKTTLTTHDRLLVEHDGREIWFDANARPTIRNIGRIMTRDPQTYVFVRTGRAKPQGTLPKRLYNFHGILEDVHVIEITAPGRVPLRFEAVQSVVVALYQWAQAEGPMSRAPQPFSSRATVPMPEHSARAYAKTQMVIQVPPSYR